MMMRMLHAAGIPLLTDALRAADDDNPLGYFELEAVKATRQDASWLREAPGKAVKLVHLLLRDLPAGHEYWVIMMRRDLDEVLASQTKMLARSGKAPAAEPEVLKRVYRAQIAEAEQWGKAQPHCRWIDISYNGMLSDPMGEAGRLARFLGLAAGSDERMAAAIDPTLYRNRRG